MYCREKCGGTVVLYSLPARSHLKYREESISELPDPEPFPGPEEPEMLLFRASYYKYISQCVNFNIQICY